MFAKIIQSQYWIKNDHKLTIKIRNKILFVGRATCLTSLSVKAQISSSIIASINSSQAIKALIMIKLFSIKSHQPSNANSLSLLKVLFTSDDGVIKTIRCLSNICNRLNLEFIKKRNNNFTKLVFSLVFQLITLVATSQNAGPSIEMDGTNDYITMGGNSTLAVSSSQGRSFLMDFKPDNYGAALISRYVNFSSGSSSFSIAINSSGKVVVTGNGLNDINSTNAVALNQWQRLAVTISSSGQAKIYIDGILDGSGTITLNSSIPSTVLTLGTFNSTQLTNRYDGTLDNLVIWDGEMTAAEVSSYSTCLPLASSTDVIGKWSFEEESGTIAADSVGTLSGTLTSAALWSNDTSTIVCTTSTSNQNAGPSIEMDGTNDYITMGGNSTLAVSSSQGRSFLMDFKPDNYGAALISRYVNFSSGSSSFSIAINSSGKVVVTGNGLNDINSTNAVALNQWQRLAVTISSSGQAKIYIDGILDGSGTITLNSSIPSTVLTLGTFNSTQLTNRYDGTLDNLVIWDGEMTAAEVSSYSTCLPLASSTDVIGKWSFEEESGTIAADSVGTLSGTLTSVALWSNDTSTIVCTTNLCTDTISVSILDTTIIFDTSYVDVFDTNYVDVFDTNYVDVFDTNYVDVFDTNYVDVFDTNYVDVFDTIFITQIDTSYLTVTDTLIIDVSLIGINPLVFEYQVLIYPNPTNSILYIEIPQSMTGQLYRIELVNPIGQLIYSSQLNQQQLQINLSSFASAGTYTLLLKDSGGTVVDTRVIILQ